LSEGIEHHPKASMELAQARLFVIDGNDDTHRYFAAQRTRRL
jgi:hypothetical protein